MGSEGSGAVLWGQAGPGLGLPAWHGVGPAAFSSFFYDMHYIYTSESKKKKKNIAWGWKQRPHQITLVLQGRSSYG